MAKISTLEKMRARVLFLGDFPNSRKFLPAIVDEEINNAIEDTWDVLIDSRPEYYVLEQTPAPVTVAGNDTVALAPTLLHLRKAEIFDGSRWRKLKVINLAESHRVRIGSGRPIRYRIQGSSLKLYPLPDSAYQMRIYYTPSFVDLVADTDTFDGINGFEEHAIVGAIYKLKMREQMPSNEWLQELQRLETKMRAAAKLDTGEPYYLAGGARLDDWGDGDDWELM